MASKKPSGQEFETVRTRSSNKLPRALRKIWALDDFQIAAKRHLPLPIYAYYASAVETEITLRANRTDFDDYEFIPRFLTDTSKRDQSVELFGKTYSAPFGIAPMGLTALACFDGDVMMAKTATAENIPSMLSAASLNPMERVAKEGNGSWCQIYQPGESDRIEAIIDRVAECGFETLVLSVDVPVGGNPENQLRYNFSSPIQPSFDLAWQGITHPRWTIETWLRTLITHGIPRFENMDAKPGPPILSKTLVRDMGERDRLNWKHVEQIRKRWKGNFIIKGILAPEDAALSREHGADGIVVSNHGGRQLDSVQSALRALPAMVKAAKGIPVMMDGGIRRGSDILKAYALGASFVFVGRPFLFAASIAGEAGIKHCSDLLKSEVDRNMALLGINSISKKTLEKVVVRRT